MSDPNQPTNTTTPDPSTSGDWRDQRRAERQARRETRRDMMGGLPIGGLILLAIGVIFLAGNFGFHLPERWWAVVILIPAVAAIVSAIRFYRTDGTMNARVTGSAVGGVIMVALALALFFGLNWGMFWPVILIVVGASILMRNYWRR